MEIKEKTMETLRNMVVAGLDELADKGEFKSKDEVCLFKELLEANQLMDEIGGNGMMRQAWYSQGGHPIGNAYMMPSANMMNGGNYSKDGWYITRENDRPRRSHYNSYDEPDVDRIADAVRRAMRDV